MKHRYIKVCRPQLNGKVERSHLTDYQEFYQIRTEKDDVDLTEKLSQWNNFYNIEGTIWAHAGKTLYKEVLYNWLGQVSKVV